MFDKVQFYLDVFPLPVLIIGPIVVALLALLIPANRRLAAALIVMVPWLTLGVMIDLETVAAAAKATGFCSFLLVAAAAWQHPGPRRRLPGVAWLYVVAALLSFLFIFTVADSLHAFAIRMQWLLLVVAALAVARTLVDDRALVEVMMAITIGLVLTIMLPLSDLILHPAQAFRGGLGRFVPYGVNANQIGIIFTMAAPLSIYFALGSSHSIWKPVLLGAGALSVAMAVLTASRSSLGIMFVVMLPIALRFTRRPGLTVVAAVIGLVGVWWVVGLGTEARFDRLTSFDTSRPEIAAEYVKIIAQRPLFGLLETSGESFLHAASSGITHPHNAYIETLYLGGFTYATPVFLIVIATLLATWRTFRRRSELACDPLLLSTLALFMVMAYAHGVVNGLIMYPTHIWSFVHVLLSMIFLSLSSDLKQTSRSAEPLIDDYAPAVDEYYQAAHAGPSA